MKKWPVMVLLVVAAVVAGGIFVWQPWAPPAPSAAEGSSQQPATGDGWTATAVFPGDPDLQARVERAEPDDKQNAVLPAATTLRALADFTVEGGQFPAGGAEVSFSLSEPLPAEAMPSIAHWNEEAEMWEPVETSLSEDRRTATASVTHFSKYGFFDYLFNAIGQVTGNAATSGVTCDQPVPEWADPRYFDDINSPVLWCGGKDAKNADLLVAKLKMNRDTAAKVTVAIDPAWAWGDLWKASPTDLATMAAAAELPQSPFSERQYLVQPFGELHFGFSRSELEGLYYGGTNQPLIQVETGWFYTAAAIMWNHIGDMPLGESPVAAVSSTMAVMDCGQALLTADSSAGAVDAFRDTLTCLGTQQAKDGLNRGVRTVLADRYPHLTDGWITVHSKKILSKFGIIGVGMKTAGISLKAFSAVGDGTLPDEVRQFKFEPSLEALKEAAAKRKASATPKSYSGSVLDVNYSFAHPASWRVSGSDGQLSISNEAGKQVAGLDVFQVWGAEGPPLSVPVEMEQNHGNFMLQESRGAECASCTTHVQSVIVDSTKTTGPPEFGTLPDLGWPQPVVVAVGLSAAQAPAVTADPRHLNGLAAVNTGVTGTNGSSTRVLGFYSRMYFQSVDEARQWLESSEHQQVVEMIASVRVR